MPTRWMGYREPLKKNVKCICGRKAAVYGKKRRCWCGRWLRKAMAKGRS